MFYSGPQETGRRPPTQGRVIFLSQPTGSNATLFPENPHTPRTMFYQVSGHPLTQASEHIKLTITALMFLLFLI